MSNFTHVPDPDSDSFWVAMTAPAMMPKWPFHPPPPKFNMPVSTPTSYASKLVFTLSGAEVPPKLSKAVNFVVVCPAVARDHTPPVHLSGSWLCGDATNGAVDWGKLVSIADNAAMTLAAGAAVAPTLRVRTKPQSPSPADCRDTLTRPNDPTPPPVAVALKVPLPAAPFV